MADRGSPHESVDTTAPDWRPQRISLFSDRGTATGDGSVKILYHHRTGSKDGQTVHIDCLVSAFRMLGHDVRVVASRRADRAAFGSDAGAVALLKRLLPAVAYESLELGHALVSFVRLWRAYRSFRPDVLYERYNLFLLAGAWLKWIYGVPFLLEVNAPLAQERSQFGKLKLKRLARCAERYTWRAADGVLPVSWVLADDLRAAVPDNLRDPRRVAASVQADAFVDIIGESGDRLHVFALTRASSAALPNRG